MLIMLIMATYYFVRIPNLITIVHPLTGTKNINEQLNHRTQTDSRTKTQTCNKSLKKYKSGKTYVFLMVKTSSICFPLTHSVAAKRETKN